MKGTLCQTVNHSEWFIRWEHLITSMVYQMSTHFSLFNESAVVFNLAASSIRCGPLQWTVILLDFEKNRKHSDSHSSASAHQIPSNCIFFFAKYWKYYPDNCQWSCKVTCNSLNTLYQITPVLLNFYTKTLSSHSGAQFLFICIV